MERTDVTEKTVFEAPQFTLVPGGTVRGEEMLVETPGYSYTVRVCTGDIYIKHISKEKLLRIIE